MRPGIAVVALPCLDEKSLSRTVADKVFLTAVIGFLSQRSLAQSVARVATG
jgi:hypothetical protein